MKQETFITGFIMIWISIFTILKLLNLVDRSWIEIAVAPIILLVIWVIVYFIVCLALDLIQEIIKRL
jgi:hypothetical protein